MPIAISLYPEKSKYIWIVKRIAANQAVMKSYSLLGIRKSLSTEAAHISAIRTFLASPFINWFTPLLKSLRNLWITPLFKFSGDKKSSPLQMVLIFRLLPFNQPCFFASPLQSLKLFTTPAHLLGGLIPMQPSLNAFLPSKDWIRRRGFGFALCF